LKVNIQEVLINFSMLPSLFETESVDGVYWTLKVEMTFYALILILLFLKLTKKTIIYGFIYIGIGIVLAILFKIPLNYYYGTLFLIGINFYQIWKEDGKWWNHVQILSCLVLSFLMAKSELIIVTLIAVAIFYLLIYEKLKFLSLSPFVFLGRISYSLYLLHQYIGYSIQLELIKLGITNYLMLILSPFLVSIILASIVTFIIEKPLLLKLQKRYPLKFV
jgi:peptidoglycan/LPS O-acetylase OafA/YrhL